jgi:hypothetical protein
MENSMDKLEKKIRSFGGGAKEVSIINKQKKTGKKKKTD